MITLGLALCFSGFAALCLAMERHHQQVFSGAVVHWVGSALRLVGWLLLASALPPSLEAQGTSIGIAVWVALLTFAGLAVMLLLTYAPRALVPLACAAPLFTLPALFL